MENHLLLEQQKGARRGQMVIAGNFEHSYLIVGFWLNSFSFSGQLLNSYLAEGGKGSEGAEW